MKVRSTGDCEHQTWFLCNHWPLGEYLGTNVHTLISDFIPVMSHRGTIYWSKTRRWDDLPWTHPWKTFAYFSQSRTLRVALLPQSSRPSCLRALAARPKIFLAFLWPLNKRGWTCSLKCPISLFQWPQQIRHEPFSSLTMESLPDPLDQQSQGMSSQSRLKPNMSVL